MTGTNDAADVSDVADVADVADVVGPVVACQDVARTFGSGPTALVAVHGTSCVVAAGDRIAIAGPSGSGKSTLLHLMAGLEAPTHGRISWPGLPTAAQERSRWVGVVFQSPSLIPTLNVTENVALPLVLAGLRAAEIRIWVERCLDQVDAAELAAKLPDELSGGQAQRVAVARVLAQQPRLILADEPTGQLDHTTGQRVLDALLAAADRVNAALVVTTHDPAVTERLRTRWSMEVGRLHTSPPAVAHPAPHDVAPDDVALRGGAAVQVRTGP